MPASRRRAAAEADRHVSVRPAPDVRTRLSALLPVKDLDKTKAALRGIQERFEAAGMVPRNDGKRIEGAHAIRRYPQRVGEGGAGRHPHPEPGERPGTRPDHHGVDVRA